MTWRPGSPARGRRFADRAEAGRRLGERLQSLAGDDVVVVGLPRGGVVVAAEVARVLHRPLDVIVVRKLGVPSQPEWAMGAVGEGGILVVDDRVVALAGVSPEDLDSVETRERAELQRRVSRFRAHHPRLPLRDRTVVVVDDGVATGSTARAACLVARAESARRVVLAVPVAPPGWEVRLGDVADELVALETPGGFVAVGQAYERFDQTTDDEVLECLASTGPGDDRPPG